MRWTQNLANGAVTNPKLGPLSVSTANIGDGQVTIEINPVSATGAATKKKGIVIRSTSELDQFNNILADQKLIELAKRIDEINPKQKEEVGATGSDVFEI